MQLSLIEYLDRTTQQYPDKTAVVDPCSSITYTELNQKSQTIAYYLQSNNIINCSVLIYAPKSVVTTCALWGILRAGCFYTFVDTQMPENRALSILNLMNPGVIFSDDSFIEKAHSVFDSSLDNNKTCKIINISDIPDCPFENTQHTISISSNSPAYVNFTSGTTGVPKGVAVSHGNVIDFIDVFVDTFEIDSTDVFGNQAPFDFDVSVKDIYSCAATGATLVIIPRDYFIKPKEIVDYIIDNNITTLVWAVSAMCFLSTMNAFTYKCPSSIKRIMFSGEVLPLKHLYIWRKHFPEALYVNLFGPTEITCNCTYYTLDNNADYETGIPIGSAFSNEEVILLDDEDNTISQSDSSSDNLGEICVAGPCVALGYYNNPEQTSLHFTEYNKNRPFPIRIYRTGDLAYYKDNLLYYAGRKDHQIKRNGHRIELSEIEFCASQIPEIIRACCVYIEKKDRLALFYVGQIDNKTIKENLSKVLPFHMVPNKVYQLEEMPINKNGKINRAMLSEEASK